MQRVPCQQADFESTSHVGCFVLPSKSREATSLLPAPCSPPCLLPRRSGFSFAVVSLVAPLMTPPSVSKNIVIISVFVSPGNTKLMKAGLEQFTALEYLTIAEVPNRRMDKNKSMDSSPRLRMW
jgi:hypothetical protein